MCRDSRPAKVCVAVWVIRLGLSCASFIKQSKPRSQSNLQTPTHRAPLDNYCDSAARTRCRMLNAPWAPRVCVCCSLVQQESGKPPSASRRRRCAPCLLRSCFLIHAIHFPLVSIHVFGDLYVQHIPRTMKFSKTDIDNRNPTQPKEPQSDQRVF